MEKKVLIADDEEAILTLVSAIIGNDGTVQVLVARDGEEAIKIARQEKPDVIFLDVLMPKMNGYEVCLALKRNPSTAGIKVVMLTGLDQEFDRRKALGDIRADAYISKPFSPVELFQVFEEMRG